MVVRQGRGYGGRRRCDHPITHYPSGTSHFVVESLEHVAAVVVLKTVGLAGSEVAAVTMLSEYKDTEHDLVLKDGREYSTFQRLCTYHTSKEGDMSRRDVQRPKESLQSSARPAATTGTVLVQQWSSQVSPKTACRLSFVVW